MSERYERPVDIVMVAYKREGTTRLVLENLKKATYHPHRVILVDNGSDEAATISLVKDGLVDVLHVNPTNIGLEMARNRGMEYVNTEYVVHIDNDILVPHLIPDWIKQEVDLLQRNPEFAVVALRPQLLVGVGPIFRTTDELVSNNVVGGVARMMLVKAVRDAGGWDETVRNEGRGGEEWDICTKLRAAGWKVGYARNIWAYHLFIDENWGYPEGMKFNRVLPYAPRDIEFDPVSMEPTIRGNE